MQLTLAYVVLQSKVIVDKMALSTLQRDKFTLMSVLALN